MNYTLSEDFFLVAGIQTSNFKGPLVIGSFSLGKGRIDTTEYGKVGGPQDPNAETLFPLWIASRN